MFLINRHVLEEIRPFPVVASAPLSAPVGEHWRSIVVPAKAVKHVFIYSASQQKRGASFSSFTLITVTSVIN